MAANIGQNRENVILDHKLEVLQKAFYAPNFEKVGNILLSACPFVCSFVRPFKKNLKLGF